MKIFPPNKETGLYELADPIVFDGRWYVRTRDRTASTYNHSTTPQYYQYLYKDLTFHDYTYHDANGKYYDTEDEALDVIIRYNETSKLFAKKRDVYVPTEKVTLLVSNAITDSRRIFIRIKEKVYYLQEDLTFSLDLHSFKTEQAALFAKLRYERIHQKDLK
jgi:hypothetical protein